MMNEIAKLVRVSVRPLGYTDRSDVTRMIDTLMYYQVLGGAVQPEDVYTNEFWEQVHTDLERWKNND